MIRVGLALTLAITLAAACGLRGELERPVPLFGNPPNEGPGDPRTIKAAEDAAKAEKERQDAERAAREATQSQPTIPMPGTPQ